MMKGNSNTELLMRPVREALDKHLGFGTPASTEIYNRAYEAVEKAGRWKPDNLVEFQRQALDDWKRKQGKK